MGALLGCPSIAICNHNIADCDKAQEDFEKYFCAPDSDWILWELGV
jgi:hypothetical protein